MAPVKALLLITCCLCAYAQTARVTVTLDAQPSAFTIPQDFLGISFEASNLLPEKDGGYILGPDNKSLIAFFRGIGIRSLRIGGSTADMPRYQVPSEHDIDQLFAFAAAANVNVIYTLRLPRANPEQDAALARYISGHYKSQLTCFEIGNEPDFYRRIYREIPDYATYRDLWKKVASAVTNTVPDAKFCGPAAGGTTAWSRSFAEDFAKSGFIHAVVMHEYPGGDGALLSGAPARDAMLSRAWLELYDRLYTSFAVTAQSHGLPYRLEETNNFTGGAKDATDTFTGSLWSLDYLHWWAAHHATGINFHNRRWILNTTIYPVKNDDDGLKSGYKLHPIAYGMKAFSIGSHGAVVPLKVANPDALNITAYAVRDGDSLTVTIINKKDPGTDGTDADVTILGPGARDHADVMLLTAPGHEPAAKEGITLGDASFEDNGSWNGTWKAGKAHAGGGLNVTVPRTSAAIVRFDERKVHE